MNQFDERYDVCICGAGLAGLCLARQLIREIPNIRVALLDRQKRPLAAGAHKVGESLVEVGANYLRETVGLADYLERVHKFKSGLRWYTKSGELAIEERSETGAPDFPLIPSMQLDRGVFENDLRQMCIDAGVDLIEGAIIDSVELGNASTNARVRFRTATGASATLSARWVVDAMGRRRYLAKKLGLAKSVEHKASACWWRISGEWDVTDAPENPSAESGWHQRELSRRWYATNHFMGRGYWVWVIPLSSHTSFGIVADEALHPVSKRSTPEAARAWLREHEPHVARWIDSAPFADFLALKNFAYTSTRFFSTDRWAVVGEAAMFADAYYSTGTDLIALQNNVLTRVIRRDLQDKLAADDLDNYNDLVAAYYECIIGLYEGQYPLFGNEFVHYIKTMWDVDFAVGATGKLGFSPHLLDDPKDLPGLIQMLKTWAQMNRGMQRMLREWNELVPNKTIDRSEQAKPAVGPGLLVPTEQVFQMFVDQLKIRDAEALLDVTSGTFWHFMEARALFQFRRALSDLPEQPTAELRQLVERALRAPSLRLDKLSLKPERWLEDGLFHPNEAEIMRAPIDPACVDYLVPAAPPREQMLAGHPRVHELFWSIVAGAPDLVACVCGERQLSYAELAALVSSVSMHLSSVSKPGPVAIFGKECVEMVACVLGALTAERPVIVLQDRDIQGQLLATMPAVTYEFGSRVLPALANPVDGYELVHPVAIAPGEPAVGSVANRTAVCFLRQTATQGFVQLKTLTHFTMMNMQLYNELALRPGISPSEHQQLPPLNLVSTSHGSYDWLLPLCTGGTLILPDPEASAPDLVGLAMKQAARLGGRPVLTGTPRVLLQAVEGNERHDSLFLVALDEPLNAAAAGRLAKACGAAINGALIYWGHEDLWARNLDTRSWTGGGALAAQ